MVFVSSGFQSVRVLAYSPQAMLGVDVQNDRQVRPGFTDGLFNGVRHHCGSDIGGVNHRFAEMAGFAGGQQLTGVGIDFRGEVAKG